MTVKYYNVNLTVPRDEVLAKVLETVLLEEFALCEMAGLQLITVAEAKQSGMFVYDTDADDVLLWAIKNPRYKDSIHDWEQVRRFKTDFSAGYRYALKHYA